MHAIVNPPVKRHRISVADYYRMGEAGIFSEDDRIELIEGDIIDMAPIGSPHSGAVTRIANLFAHSVGKSVVVSVRNPIHLDDFSEPQPDVVLLRFREDYYARSHPQPADILLVVEVAETSLSYDRDVKLPLYARHGIAEVWLLDLAGGCLHVYRAPRDGAYTEMETVMAARVLAPAALPGAAIDLAGLL
jgi:Uma2 family endonuclease